MWLGSNEVSPQSNVHSTLNAYGFPMAETKRHRRNYDEPGHAHELTFSCYKRFPFLKSHQTCTWLAESIAATRTLWKYDLWAYVFMPDHVHLVIHPRESNYSIAQIRKAIEAPVAFRALQHLERHSPEWMPKVTRTRNGKPERLFWQSGGGFDRNIYEPSTFLKMIDYIHHNPIRAGLAKQPDDWDWSSAGWFIDRSGSLLVPDAIPPEWLDHG